MNAFLVVDKPPGPSSHDVVGIVRAVTGLRKVGHTGTLDPFASGVLVLALGGATRLIRFLDEDPKVYDATISLGTATTTGDPEGEVCRRAPVPSLDGVEAVLQGFVGERLQKPPAYSAVKYKGRPLYKYAREGRMIDRPARAVRIHSMRLLDTGPDWLRVEIRCTRGTYARVLADEIARALGSAGHLGALRRTGSGPFTLDQAVDMESLARIASGTGDWRLAFRTAPGQDRVEWLPRDRVRSELSRRCVPLLRALAGMPSVEVPPDRAGAVASGRLVPPPPAGLAPELPYLARCGERVLAVAELRGRSPRGLVTLGGARR